MGGRWVSEHPALPSRSPALAEPGTRCEPLGVPSKRSHVHLLTQSQVLYLPWRGEAFALARPCLPLGRGVRAGVGHSLPFLWSDRVADAETELEVCWGCRDHRHRHKPGVLSMGAMPSHVSQGPGKGLDSSRLTAHPRRHWRLAARGPGCRTPGDPNLTERTCCSQSVSSDSELQPSRGDQAMHPVRAQGGTRVRSIRGKAQRPAPPP